MHNELRKMTPATEPAKKPSDEDPDRLVKRLAAALEATRESRAMFESRLEAKQRQFVALLAPLRSEVRWHNFWQD